MGGAQQQQTLGGADRWSLGYRRKWLWSQLIDKDIDDDEEEPDLHTVSSAKKRSKSGVVSTTLEVNGMCCPAEAEIIRRVLEPLGPKEIAINVVTRTVTVTHDVQTLSVADMLEALHGVALTAREQRHSMRRKRRRRLPVLLCLACVFWLFALLGAAVSTEIPLLRPVWWVAALMSMSLTVPKVMVRACGALSRCLLDVNVLVLLAAAGAVMIGSYAEACTVLFLFSLAEVLEQSVTSQARSALQEVLELKPLTAELVSGETVSVDDVELGSQIVVRQGDVIPLDGEVIRGICAVDESMLTGESLPAHKIAGAQVWAGTTSTAGYAVVRTTARASDTAVARFVELVQEAQTRSSDTEKVVERFAKRYTSVILIASALLMTVPWVINPEVAPEYFYCTLVLLVVGCPCALVVSTPVSYVSGIAAAASHSILVRGGVDLEALGAVRVVALDKTGTLTEGRFGVRGVLEGSDWPGFSAFWQTIALVEACSSHPLASALLHEAKEHGISASSEAPADVIQYLEIAGEGVQAKVRGSDVAIGNARLAERMGWPLELSEEFLQEKSGTVLWVGSDTRHWGCVRVADTLRQEAEDMCQRLREMRLELVMLTGDALSAAEAVGSAVGISMVKAALKPEDKTLFVKDSREKARKVAMVGDGINDMLALKEADVGIAMGAAGRPAVLENASIVLMDSDLRKLVLAFELARQVLWTIRVNIGFAIMSKLTMVTFTLMGYVSLWGAVAVDVGAMLVVTLHGMLILRQRKVRHHYGDKAEGPPRHLDGDVELQASPSDHGGHDDAPPPPPVPMALPDRGGCRDPRCAVPLPTESSEVLPLPADAESPALPQTAAADEAELDLPLGGRSLCAGFGGGTAKKKRRFRPLLPDAAAAAAAATVVAPEGAEEVSLRAGTEPEVVGRSALA